MKVYIVAEVELVDGVMANEFHVTDALAQTLGGEVGSMMFEVEDGPDDDNLRQSIYRLTMIGGHPGDVPDPGHFPTFYPVDELSGEVQRGPIGLRPVKRYEP